MIKAQIVADNYTDIKNRIISYVCTYPRFIHCFDKETEVLCRINNIVQFRLWPDIIGTDCELATYHLDKSITFEKPKKWVQEYLNGKLVRIENNRLSMLVTQDHRLYIGSRKSKNDKWEIIYAKELLHSYTQKRFTTYGYYEGKSIGLLAALIGFFVGDGWLVGNTAGFHLRRIRKIKYVDTILAKLSIQNTKVQYKDGCVNIKIKDYI